MSVSEEEDHPLWPALAVDRERFFSLPVAMRGAVLQLFELSPARKAGRALGQLIEAPWFYSLDEPDQIRAMRVVSYLAASGEGARPQPGPVSRGRIIENTLGLLLGPKPVMSLVFEDLPFGARDLVAGMRRLPSTIVLNRRAIGAQLLRLGEDRSASVERRVGTCTLVHEANHLCNPTPVGPTFAAFMDEYRAWLVDFVVFADRAPRMVEGWQRCCDLLTQPRYADVGAVADQPKAHERVLGFLRYFGDFRSITDAIEGRVDDFVTLAPLPDPIGDLENLGDGLDPSV